MKSTVFDPIKSAAEMVKWIRLSSIFGSFLFILPYLLGAFVLIAFSDNTIAQIFLMVIIGVLFAVFIVIYLVIFFYGDHKELQSEDQIYRMKALEVIGDQGHTLNELKNIENENNPALPDPKKEILISPSNSLDKHHG